MEKIPHGHHKRSSGNRTPGLAAEIKAARRTAPWLMTCNSRASGRNSAALAPAHESHKHQPTA